MIEVRYENRYETIDIEPLFDYFKDLVNLLKDSFGIPKDFEIEVEKIRAGLFECYIDVTPECRVYAKIHYPPSLSIPKTLTQKTEDIVRYITFLVFNYLGFIGYWYRYKIFNIFLSSTPCRYIKEFYGLCLKYLRGEITKDRFKKLVREVVGKEHEDIFITPISCIAHRVFEKVTAVRYAVEVFRRLFPGADEFLRKIISSELEEIDKTVGSGPIAKVGMKYQLEYSNIVYSVELAVVGILDNAALQAFGLGEDISKYKYLNIVYEFLKSKIPNLEDRVREVMFEEDFRRKMWLAKRLSEDIVNALLEHTKKRYIIEYILADEWIAPIVDSLWVPEMESLTMVYTSNTPTLDALKHGWKTIILCLDVYE